MQIGMVGLGRMGANMVRRLMERSQDCVVYDRDPESGAAVLTVRHCDHQTRRRVP